MSRSDDCGDDWDGPDTTGLYAANARRALYGRRGQQALRGLRDALLAFPEKGLIEGALCTVARDKIKDRYERAEAKEARLRHGEGVCAVGAYIWWNLVKKGMDAREAFAHIPTLDDTEYSLVDTANEGANHGLTLTLAWEIAQRNDGYETDGLTPEERYAWFLAWIDRALERAPRMDLQLRKKPRTPKPRRSIVPGNPTARQESLPL